MSITWTTPFLATLSLSMMFPTARSLDMVTWRGNVVTVSFSPAPVTSGVEPGGKLADMMLPFVMCLSRVNCSSFGWDNRDWNIRHLVRRFVTFLVFTLNNGIGSPSKASFVGAKTVIGPGRERMSMRSASLSIETNIEKSWLWASSSRAEHLPEAPPSVLQWTAGGILACRLGGLTGLEGSIGCCRGAMKGSRLLAVGAGRSGDINVIIKQLFLSIKTYT